MRNVLHKIPQKMNSLTKSANVQRLLEGTCNLVK